MSLTDTWREFKLHWSSLGKSANGTTFIVAGAMLTVIVLILPLGFYEQYDREHGTLRHEDVIVTSISTGGFAKPGQSPPLPLASFLLHDRRPAVVATALPIHVGGHVEVTYRAGKSGNIYVERLDLPTNH